MYLLLDECCGKRLKPLAEDEGHAAQRSIEVGELGQGASDADIFAFAAAKGAVVVTINQGDFLVLAQHATLRPGLLLLPSLRGSELAKLFKAALPALTVIFDSAPDAIVKVNDQGSIQRLD